MERTKPTDKYKSYEERLRRQHAFVEAILNDGLEEVHRDELSQAYGRGKESRIWLADRKDWTEDTLIFLVTEVAGRKHMAVLGRPEEYEKQLAKDIGAYAVAWPWLREAHKAVKTWREANFDKDGGRIKKEVA